MDFKWKQLHVSDMQALNDAQAMVHQAVQFIGLVGKQVIPQEDDDGNTNMEWLSNSNMFAGNWVNGIIRVGLSLPDFSMHILNSANEIVRSKELDGLNMKAIFSWLKMELIMNGALAQGLELKLHYKIKKHPVHSGEAFQKPSEELLTELSNHRSNAQAAIEVFIEDCEHASEIRTWPHHFDHGTFIPIQLENEEVIQAFSMGYTPADELIDEPYFYVTQYVKSGKLNYMKKPELTNGIWHPGGLAGSALEISDILKSKDQIDIISTYLTETKAWSMSADVIS